MAEKLRTGKKKAEPLRVDLKRLELTGTRAPVDLHVHLRKSEAVTATDETFILPLCVGLAAVALGREMASGIALLGMAPLCFPGAPVAPVAGPDLSGAATKACTTEGILRVVRGKRVRSDGDGGSAQPSGGDVAYEGVDDLYEALRVATQRPLERA
jgi:hypothetical protein